MTEVLVRQKTIGPFARRPHRVIGMICPSRDLGDNRRLAGYDPLGYQLGYHPQAWVRQQSRGGLQELMETVLQFALRQLGKDIVMRYAHHCSAPGNFGGCNYQMYPTERSLSIRQTCE
jgi:hypothetical protein